MSLSSLCRSISRLKLRPDVLSQVSTLRSDLCQSSLLTKFRNNKIILNCTNIQIYQPFSTSSKLELGSLEYYHNRGKLKKKKKEGTTWGKPQLKGVVTRVLVKKPKKPNSANRKCVRVRLSNGIEVTAFIPGIGHNLQEHSIVLVNGARVKDLPGVKHTCVRGKHDLGHVVKQSGD